MGLGNPGVRFVGTRHNVGFAIVRALARRHGIELASERFAGRYGTGRVAGHESALLLPETMMNASGDAVRQALAALPEIAPETGLIVVYDDLDLPTGRIRLRPGGGAGGQRGLAHIIDSTGRQDFARLRFGIGRPPPGVDARDHVLGVPTGDEAAVVANRIEVAVDAIECALSEGIARAMDRFNRSDPDTETVAPPASGPVASPPAETRNPGWRRFIPWLDRGRRQRVR